MRFRYLKLIRLNKSKTFAIVFSILLLLTLNPFSPFVERESVKAAWWNSDWSYCKKITIDHNYVDGDLTNFPILFDNISSDFTHAQADGDDFIFRSSDNSTKYNHEIEWFNVSGDNCLKAWVNITSLSSTVDTVLWLYYGNASASNQQNVESTWDNDFFAVHHMNGAINYLNITDSTSYNHDATSEGGDSTYHSTGKIGYAVDFDGTLDEIELDQVYSATNNSDDILTIECWLNADSSDTNYFLAQHQTAGADGFIAQYSSNNLETFFDGNSALEYGMSYANNWFYVCFKQSANAGADKRHLFINDTMVDNEAGVGITWNAGQNFHIANRGVGAREFDGTIDEIRLHNTSRSDSWIKTTYNTTMYPNLFLSVGSEQVYAPSNNAPTQTNHKSWKTETDEEKTLSAIGVDLQPTSINVTINDAEGNLMNLSLYWNNSNIWKTINSTTNQGNGTHAFTNTSFINIFDTVYTLSFNLSDGTSWVNTTKTLRTGNFTNGLNTNVTRSGCARFGFILPSATNKGEFIQTTQGGTQGEPNVDDMQYAIYNINEGWTTTHQKVFAGSSNSAELIHNSWGYVNGEYRAIGVNESSHDIAGCNSSTWSGFSSQNCTQDQHLIVNPSVTDCAPIMYTINSTDAKVLYEDNFGAGIWAVHIVNYTSGAWQTPYHISETEQPSDNQIRGQTLFRINETHWYIYYVNRTSRTIMFTKSTDSGLTWSAVSSTGITNGGDTGTERISIARYGTDKYYMIFSNNTGNNVRIYSSDDAESWSDTGNSIGATDTSCHGTLLHPGCLMITYPLGAGTGGWNWVRFVNITKMNSYANKTDTPYPLDAGTISSTSTYLNTTVHGNQTYDVAFYWSNGTYIDKDCLLEEGDIASIYVTGLSYGNTYSWYTINRGTSYDSWRPAEPVAVWDENQSSTWSFDVSGDAGTNYYISNGGADSNSGTSPGEAWENMSKLDAELQAGGDIYDGDNIYFNRGDTFNTTTGYIRLKQTDGTPSNSMVFGAYGTGADPIITCSAGMGNPIFYMMSDETGYWTFRNLYFLCPKNCGEQHFMGGNTGDHYNLTIHNCTFDGNNYGVNNVKGIVMPRSVRNVTVRDCNFTDAVFDIYPSASADKTKGENTILMNCVFNGKGGNTDNIQIHHAGDDTDTTGGNHYLYNVTSYNCGANAFDIVGGLECEHVLLKECVGYGTGATPLSITHQANNVVVDSCLFYGSVDCLTIGNSNNTIIRNSVFKNNGSGLISVGNRPQWYYGWKATQNLTMYNNDFINDGSKEFIRANAYHKDINLTGFFVKNNIFYSTNYSSPSGFIYYNPNGDGIWNLSNTDSNYSYNLWWKGDGDLSSSTLYDFEGEDYSFSTWNTADEVYGDISDNASLSNPTGVDFTNDFNLNADSPCIDAGDWLTQTNGGGTGTTITVDEANYFFPGLSFANVPGDNIFVGDDTNLVITDIDYDSEQITVNRSITWGDDESVSLSDYSDSKPDIGAKEYSTLGNTNPTITNEVPADGSADIALQPTCNITVNDADGDTMNVTFASDYSGSWTNYQTNSTVGNGTYRWNFTGANTNNTVYNWRVYCNDGTTNISETYDFTTPWSNTAPALSAESPTNASIDVSRNPQLSVTVNDVDGNNSNVYWYTNDTGPWYLMQTNSSILDETVRLMTFTNASSYPVTYYWKVSANDTHDNTTEIYHFTTTANRLPINSAPSPTATITGLNPTLRITVSDPDGHIMNQTFRTNASGNWSDIAWNSNTGNASLSNSTSVFSSYSTEYWWSSNVSDGNGGWDNNTYSFTTSTLKDTPGGEDGDEEEPPVIAGLEVNYIAFVVLGVIIIIVIAIAIFYRKEISEHFN